MKKSQTTIIPHRSGKCYYIYVPINLALDSAFPFKAHEKVIITIQENKLLVEKIK
jgi:hypothetical protein